MAKIIVSCRFKKNAKGVKNLIKYMGTRESVEKLPSAREYDLASLSQVRLIKSVTNHFPQSKTFLEYTDYKMLPTRQNAHEFLDAVAERYADCADELKGLVGYISQRPGVEKLGKHGLFSQFDLPIDLDEVAKNVSEHNGIIWTEVVSLRREDAERLHYNNAEAWKNLVRRNMNEIARAHRIQPKDLHWYAAFHNTTHHPHIHLIVYSTGAEGYLSEKGIRQLRRAFGQDIFRGEQYRLAKIETGYRNDLKQELMALMEDVQAHRNLPNTDYYLQILQRIQKEVQEQKGKKLYGYLPRKVKKLVDFALHELASEPRMKALYDKWIEINREKLSLYYDPKEEPPVPIERNIEFRSLKNLIIKTALSMDFSQENNLNAVRFGFLISSLARTIAQSAQKKLSDLNAKMPLADSKEREKIREKKLAHGQKDGSDQAFDNDDETYDSQAVEGILSMLDYLLSLDEQTEEEEPTTTNIDNLNIDQSYARYEAENVDDEDLVEDYDEDEGESQGWGQSM